MRRASITRLFKGLTALLLLATICSLPLAVMGYFGYIEHHRRMAVLETGEIALARVLRSRSVNSRGCVFEYQFVFAGHAYTGGEGGCGLVIDHPAGTRLPVRFARSEPENSVAIGADIWPGWIAVPILLGLSLLLLGGVISYAVLRDALRSRLPRKSPA